MPTPKEGRLATVREYGGHAVASASRATARRTIDAADVVLNADERMARDVAEQRAQELLQVIKTESEARPKEEAPDGAQASDEEA